MTSCKFAGFEKEAKSAKRGIMMRRVPGSDVRAELWLMWQRDYPELRSTLKEKREVDKEKTKSQAS
jgi:hypothetical protein